MQRGNCKEITSSCSKDIFRCSILLTICQPDLLLRSPGGSQQLILETLIYRAHKYS